MAPLHYSIPTGDARWTRILAFCPLHPDEKVAHWSTFDGERTLIWINEASRQEYVGKWMPDEEERRTMPPEFMLPIAEAPAADSAHFRFHLRCSKPSCRYRGVYRADQFEPMKTLARLKWQAGERTYGIGDVDSFLRSVLG